MRARVLVAGVAALMFASACAPDPDDPLEAPSPAPIVNAPPPSGPAQTTQTAAPTPAPAPAPTAPAPQTQTPAPVSGPTAASDVGVQQPAATPAPTPAPTAQQPAPTPTATPQGSPTAQPSSPGTSPGSTTTGSTSTSGTSPNLGFNAGSGVLQPDGKTVVYRIPDGTGGNDWNDKKKPIRVQRGMTLRLIDDDKSTAAGGHWLHTYGQPCVHGDSAIGTGFDCVINKNAPMGLNTGVAEHNIFNGIGYLWIEVVAN